MGRRHLLLGLLAGASPFLSAKAAALSGQAPLRDRAETKGIIYGAFPSVSYDRLTQLDPQFRSVFLRECNLLVSGFYWNAIRPSANAFDFRETDAFARFAAQHGMKFRGHPLVWNQLNPDWLGDRFNNPATTSQTVQSILTHHITTVVRRYAGRVHSWDVVNEAIWIEDKQTQGLRRSPWLDFLGPDYIDIAFRTARKADPKALLVYNGDRLDHDTPDDEARRVATLRLLKRLVAKGTPVQALGIQAHLQAGKPFNAKRLKAFLREVANLGLKIFITELDVKDSELPAEIVVRDRIVANTYRDYLLIVLSEPAVKGVITWGLSDRYTWLSQYAPRRDRKPLRPLPFGEKLERKLAWSAIAHAFDRAPRR